MKLRETRPEPLATADAGVEEVSPELSQCKSRSGSSVPSFSSASVDDRATLALPFVHLNLRRNPFGEITRDETASLALVEIEPLVEKLTQPGFAVQLIGEKGFGKTTHLLAIRRRFERAAYVHIPEGERAEIPQGNPLLIDEAQRLTWGQRRAVFGGLTPLVLGTHVDYRRALARHGRRVETVAVEQRMSPERLCRILNARIDWVRRGAGPVPRIELTTARRLLERHGPNVRGILGELYFTFQQMNRVQDV